MVKLPSYQVTVTSPQSGNIVAVIPLVESYALKYDRLRNEIGAFALTLPYTESYYSIFDPTTPDAICDIQRSDPDGVLQTEATYLVRKVERIASGDDDRIVVSGVHANHLLKRRFIDPADDSVQPNGGYATKAGDAAEIIREYVREQAGVLASADRQTVGLTVPVPIASGVGAGGNFRFENLWDEMIKIARQANIALEVVHNGGRDFECLIGLLGGTDRTVTTQTMGSPPYDFGVFSPVLGNLEDLSYVHDRTAEITVVRIQGAGARENRTALTIVNPSLTASVYNRIEDTNDARGTDDSNPLQRYTQGLRFLRENEAMVEFSATPLFTSGGAVYRRNWQFGDILTFEWDNITTDLRVDGLSFEVSENSESLEVTLSDE